MPDSSSSSNSPSHAPHSKSAVFSPKTAVFIIIALLALLFAMGSQERDRTNPAQATSTSITAQQINNAPARSAKLPPDAETTTGVILGGIFLLLIIIFGTLGVIRHKDR